MNLGTKALNPIAVGAYFQLATVGYVANGASGVLGSGGQHSLLPFGANGAGAGTSSIDLQTAYTCLPNPCGYAAAVVMPDPATAIVATNTNQDNYLVEVSGVNVASQTFSTIAIGQKAPDVAEDTAGLALAMSGSSGVMVTRGGYETVFTVTGPAPYTFAETGQVGTANGLDNPDRNSERGREGMFVFNNGGDFELLSAGTSGQTGTGGTVWIVTNLATAPTAKSSAAFWPAQHAYAVTTDGKLAFVGTDLGIGIVNGVSSGTLGTPSLVVNAPAGIGATLVQVSNVAVTPDKKWLVAMGLPSTSGASVPGGSGYLDVFPITSTGIGPAIYSIPIVVPNDDQIVTY